MTYLQGGRRRRRPVRGLFAIAAVLAAVALGALFIDRGPDAGTGAPPASMASPSPLTPRAIEERTDPPPRPLAYGALPAPASTRVSAEFRRPPRAGLLWDLRTGRVLWARNPDRRYPIASLTKMMTALVVVDRAQPREPVRITRQALAYRGSGIGILPLGRRIELETLLYGLMLPSGNDAAIALAQHVGGSVPGFIELMNSDAERLDLRCTRFASVDGYSSAGNYSCARDLALLAREVLRRPRLARIVRTRQAIRPFPIKGRRIYLANHNPLLVRGYRGVTGVKTGYTEPAGRCFVATAKRGDVRLGALVLDSVDPGGQAGKLLDRGFAKLGGSTA